MLDQFEWRDAQEGDGGAWDAQAWYGGDYNKLWVKTEGERIDGVTRDASADILFDRVVTPWWSAQGGIRQDFGKGPARTWLALGLQGLTTYWFDAEATFYVGEEGRTAARLKADYDLLITQRLILQPYSEINLYSKADPDRQLGSGLSDLELSLRLRYEVRRELAPYVGGGVVPQIRRNGRPGAGRGAKEVMQCSSSQGCTSGSKMALQTRRLKMMKTTRILAGLVLSLAATVALAHAHLKKAVPADGAVVSTAPANVVLSFSEPAHLTACWIQKGDGPKQKVTGCPRRRHLTSPFLCRSSSREAMC